MFFSVVWLNNDEFKIINYIYHIKLFNNFRILPLLTFPACPLMTISGSIRFDNMGIADHIIIILSYLNLVRVNLVSKYEPSLHVITSYLFRCDWIIFNSEVFFFLEKYSSQLV